MIAINLSAYRALLPEGESVTHHVFLSVRKCWLPAALSRTCASQPGHTNDGSPKTQGVERSANTDPDLRQVIYNKIKMPYEQARTFLTLLLTISPVSLDL